MALAVAQTVGLARIAPLPLLHPLRDYNFFDLRVYRAATGVVSAGGPLYTTHLRHGLGFTYPPFAVLVMLPLRWVSMSGDELVVTLANIVLVAVTAHAVVRLRPSSRNRATAGWLTAAVMLWAEPVISAIGYGQIDLLIAALVIADLAYAGRSRVGGIGIGLAAAIKLTPLIFIPYLLFTGRRPSAANALTTFAASIAVAFVALPRDATRYWGGTIFDFSRVTGRHHLSGGGPANQSLRGALLRLFPSITHIDVLWLPVCVIVGALGLLLAVGAARRGEELQGYLLTAITGLLISPISWTHHWALVVPGVVALATTWQHPGTRRVLIALAVELAIASSAIWLVIDAYPVGQRLNAVELLVANAYVVAGLGAIAVAAAMELQRVATRRSPRVRRRTPQPLRVIPEGLSGP